MSINGSNSEDFYKYCKDQGTTLIIIKTAKNKNIWRDYTS